MPADPSATIAPTARVHPDASIGAGTRVGEFCIIDSDVVIGAGCVLEPYVYVKRWTTLGEENQISAGTVLGTDPLDKGFTGRRSFLTIGHRNRIREHYTISRGTKPESTTTIGDDNYIMTSGHIAHNCVIGNRVVIASCALVAGYAEVNDGAFLSGGVVVHQFARVGSLAMVGGNSRVAKDLPPYFLYHGFDATPRGLNVVGLRRAGFTADEVRRLKSFYRLLYRSGLKLQEALSQLAVTKDPLAEKLGSFIRSSQRGIARERSGEAED